MRKFAVGIVLVIFGSMLACSDYTGPELFTPQFAPETCRGGGKWKCPEPPDTTPPPDTIPPPPEDTLPADNGAAIFAVSCAGCHASRDAMDLAFFAYPDSTVIRRALPHVSRSEAEAVAAYVQTLSPTSGGYRARRIFQPSDEVLSNDAALALRLFGVDLWPEFASFGTAALRAVRATDLPVALPMPLWSDEAGTLEWMPEHGILMALPSTSQNKIANYYAARTTDALIQVVSDLTWQLENGVGPCVGGNKSVRPVECFQGRLWVVNLLGQHLVRNGLFIPADARLLKAWWSLGYSVRQAKLAGQPLPNQDVLWATWMYLGWALEVDQMPFGHNIVYMGEPFIRMGLPRHMVWVALRDVADRPVGDVLAYEFSNYAVEFAPAGDWTYRAMKWACLHLLERLDGGDTPTNKTSAQHWIEYRALNAAQPKVTFAQYAELQALVAQIVDRLQER